MKNLKIWLAIIFGFWLYTTFSDGYGLYGPENHYDQTPPLIIEPTRVDSSVFIPKDTTAYQNNWEDDKTNEEPCECELED